MEYAQLFDYSTVWIINNALNIATAVAILFAGLFLAKLVGQYAVNLLPRTRAIDSTIAPVISQVVRYSIIVITVIVVLSQFGVNTASVLAVLGAAGIAIALALQGTLSNMAAGIMMIWLRPFHVGEFIDAEGIMGTVVEIGLFGTRLRSYDGIFLFVPNSRLWSAKVTNFTREKTRMVETKIAISYRADIQAARAALLTVASDPRVLAEPEPFVFVDALNEGAMILCMRSWVAGTDWWKTNVDFREAAKLALDKAGIEIPYSQLNVFLRNGPETTGQQP